MKGRKQLVVCRCIVMIALIGIISPLFSSVEALADEYDPQEAGHPLRVAAYLLHPVGVLIDYALMRPAHWLVHQAPLDSIFGHESKTSGPSAMRNG